MKQKQYCNKFNSEFKNVKKRKLDNSYDNNKAEADFRGALSEYRDARSKNNTAKMEYWGEKALAFYDRMTDEQKAEHSISQKYLTQDQGKTSDGISHWAKKATRHGI